MWCIVRLLDGFARYIVDDILTKESDYEEFVYVIDVLIERNEISV